MKKRLVALIWVLIFSMMLQACGSCRGNETVTSESTLSNESGLVEGETFEETSTEKKSEETEQISLISGENAEMIELADRLKNNVTAYFPENLRKSIVYENMEMKLEYLLSTEFSPQVGSITNKNGNAYVEDTMDVFVKMSNGKTYYASETLNPATPNIYRMGYYFYEMRNDNQMFWNDDVQNKTEMPLDVKNTITGINGVSVRVNSEGVIRAKNPSDPRDPQVLLSTNLDVNTKEYPFLQITMKADKTVRA